MGESSEQVTSESEGPSGSCYEACCCGGAVRRDRDRQGERDRDRDRQGEMK